MSSSDSTLFETVCPFDHVTIIGAGLIGGSFAWLMRERFDHENLAIHLIDQNESTLQSTLKKGIASTAKPQLPNDFTGNHLVVLATHLDGNEALLREVATRVQDENVLVTDMGSCKRDITEIGFSLLPHQFVGGHPMAGREKAGFEHASSLLFYKKRFLLTPHPDFKGEALLLRFRHFLEQVGMIPVLMEAHEHDIAMAYVSHLPQLYAVVLTNLIAQHRPGHLLAFQGGGIDDQLRLAASPAMMWTPIYQRNADNMKAVLDEMIGLLQTMRDNIDNPVAVQEWFNTSNTIHTAYQQLKLEQNHLLQNRVL